MGCGDLKNLLRRAASDKVLQNKAFYIAKNPKSDEYQRGIASIVFKLFDKSLQLCVQINFLHTQGQKLNLNFENQQLAKELHKMIIRKLKKRKIYSLSRDNI